MGCSTLLPKLLFNGLESPAEFAVGVCKSGLRIDLQPPREVGHCEQKVPDLLSSRLSVRPVFLSVEDLATQLG